MDRPLDEVISDRQTTTKAEYKDLDKWVSQSPRLMQNVSEDSDFASSEWVHDRYDDDPEGSPGISANIIQDLFTRIGPINHLTLRYDRAGRSTGTAFVTYPHIADARLAIREFDGANAHGQPIRLTLLPTAPANDIIRGRGPGPVAARNPFDTVERPTKSLFDRIDDPGFGSGSASRSRNRGGGGRSRSRSPGKPRRSDVSRPAPEGVDRYVPGGSSRVRSRSPRRRGGDVGRGRGRGGERRGGGGGGGVRESAGGGVRPRKTQEELDQEMEDYWGPSASGQPNGATAAGTAAGNQNGVASTPAPVVVGGDDEDIDMGVE
ncbi:MAG: hypothetical protein Q9169_003339 [Polycauliona sp. 2 TL-2023]